MSYIAFKKLLKKTTDKHEILNIFTSEVEQSLKLACGEFENTKITALNYTETGTIIVKARIKNEYLYVALSNTLDTLEKVYEITQLNPHTLLFIGESTYKVLTRQENNFLLDIAKKEYEITEEEAINQSEIKYNIVNEFRHTDPKNTVYFIIEYVVFYSLNILESEERKARSFSNVTKYDKLHFEKNKIYNLDCMEAMKLMGDECVDFVLTDIPYEMPDTLDSNSSRVNSKALQVLDKGTANILTFKLEEFISEIVRISSNSLCVFCEYGQVGDLVTKFRQFGLTTRLIVWEKTQFSPMNGDIIYGSNIEVAVWGKKHNNGVFNAFCKGTVFKYGNGSSKLHPTQKNVDLFRELIEDNTNEGMLVFDPCIGSGTTAESALNCGRDFIGFEKDIEYYNVAQKRLFG